MNNKKTKTRNKRNNTEMADKRDLLLVVLSKHKQNSVEAPRFLRYAADTATSSGASK